MWHFSSRLTRRLSGDCGLGGRRLVPVTGLPRTADAQIYLSTRTSDARAQSAARPAIFERVHLSLGTAVRAWSEFNDNAHADRRAPPGRDKGGGAQGKPDRGI